MNRLKFSIKYLLLAIVSIMCSFISALSQEMMVARLTDSELKSVLPILKAEVMSYRNLAGDIASDRNSHYQLFLDIRSGKTDPLEWLKQHSKHILVPPEAKYEPDCSRAVSLGGFSSASESELAEIKPGAVPTAIFTFGKELGAINRKALGQTITMDNYEKFLQQINSLTDQDYADIKSIIDRAVGFYSRNGFMAGYETMADGPSRTTAYFYYPEDEGYISGTIYHLDAELFSPYFPETVKQCLQYPLGPSIKIKAEQKLLEKGSPPSGTADKTDQNIINSLNKAGISAERYALIKSSLIRARNDSENPDAIEVPEFDFVPATQEEKEMLKTLNQMKADALARKGNVLIYNKFKAEIDPILDILQQFMY